MALCRHSANRERQLREVHVKKLVCLLGSPRRGGNSDTLAQHVCRAFSEEGGAVEQIALSKLDLRP